MHTRVLTIWLVLLLGLLLASSSSPAIAAEQAKLTAGDAAAGDQFGFSVSVSGDTAVVGAVFDDDNGTNSGLAYVFVRDAAGVWSQQAKLPASDGAAFDNFGSAVSVSGNTAVVGALNDGDAGSSSGSAYIFERDQGGVDNWGQVAKLTASDAAAFDRFGFSVSVSGDTAVVGAVFDDDAGSGSGSAYIFERSGTVWTEQAKLTASDAATGDLFGRSVSVSGDTAVVGAVFDDDAGSSSGSAYIFERDAGGENNWGQVKKLTASDPAAGDRFGRGVSVSGDTAVVGARFDDDAGGDSGSAYVFGPDTTPPDTTITSALDGDGDVVTDGGSTDSSSITFTFEGTDNVGVAGFECSLDGAAFASCTSPETQSGLATGSHNFQVRAIDTAGNVDSTPASFIWTIDVIPPETSISLAIDGDGDAVTNGATVSTSITFTFEGTDNVGVASFDCSLDGAAFASCTSPETLGGLATGSRNFQVRAIDTVGNVDLTPASFTWTVLTPEEAIQLLINDVTDLVTDVTLNQGQGQALTGTLGGRYDNWSWTMSRRQSSNSRRSSVR